MKRKGLVIIAAIAAVLVSILAGASAPTGSAWILLPDTKIMKEASFDSEVVCTCNQNENVVLVGEKFSVGEVVWQKVTYNGVKEGYLPYDLLYFTKGTTTEVVRLVKITPDKMGQTVPLYKVLGEEAELELSDGEHVMLLETKADYGEFSLVEYNGQRYFVKTANITDTLTYNQKVAILIAAIVAGLLVCLVAIILIYRKKMQNK